MEEAGREEAALAREAGGVILTMCSLLKKWWHMGTCTNYNTSSGAVCMVEY
ncbi:unnamed protein product [Timema podura]|uniref:Uncharacterized protein n=1 Tax=Timema podura TaxID=61482 RepID=A0ABN7PCG3_TIMPD|nr:unnamed protein product [Timema podura]